MLCLSNSFAHFVLNGRISKDVFVEKVADAYTTKKKIWGSKHKSHKGTGQGSCWLGKIILFYEKFILHGLNGWVIWLLQPNEKKKLVWDALKEKHDTEEVQSKNYATSRYLRFQMTNGKAVDISLMKCRK